MTTNGSSADIDIDAFRFRRFVERLGEAQDLEVRDGVKLRDVAGILGESPKAVHFTNIEGGGELAGNIFASRKRLAFALGVDAAEMRDELVRRMQNNRPEIVVVSREQAPVQEEVQTGSDVDLLQLPLHLHHELDGAPCMCVALDFSTHPDTGRPNVGARRMMWYSRDKITMSIGGDLRANYNAARARGENLPVTIVVGTHPLDVLAGTMPATDDEAAMLSKLRGGPLPLVKGITNDVLAPADAEWSIEGYLGEEMAEEAPFGEWLGYYGEMTNRINPLFHVTAITRRRDALFETLTISTPPLEQTDMCNLQTLMYEVDLLRALKTTVVDPIDVFVPPSSGGHNVRIKMRSKEPGEARTAIMTAFAQGYIFKNVFVVDPDIDIYSDSEMEWALASRFQADRDLVVVSGIRAIPGPWDPSLPRGVWVGAKAGYDLTFGPGQGPTLEGRPRVPQFGGRRFPSLRAALDDGPKYFEELMAAVDSPDGREVVLFLDEMRNEGLLRRQPSNGRYFLEGQG